MAGLTITQALGYSRVSLIEGTVNENEVKHMSTVLREEGFRFMIRSNDHNPPHVHVIKGDGQVKILLGSESEAPEIYENWMTERDAIRAWRIVVEKQEYLLDEWGKIHGKLEV